MVFLQLVGLLSIVHLIGGRACLAGFTGDGVVYVEFAFSSCMALAVASVGSKGVFVTPLSLLCPMRPSTCVV